MSTDLIASQSHLPRRYLSGGLTKPAPVEERAIQVALNVPQAQFMALPHKYKMFVGGYGSGKTFVGCNGIAKHHTEHPRINSGYFGATYPQIRDIFYPTVEEALHPWGFRVEIKEGNKEVDIYRGRTYMGTTICRSMEKPHTIVGFKIGHALVDEIDLLKLPKAKTAQQKIIARLRYKVDGLRNGIDFTTTPEGFGFAYNVFVKDIKNEKDPVKRAQKQALYGMLRASTYDNEANLPDDYIDSILTSYPPQLIQAYIEGLFVNLKTGTVYAQYDRVKNNCNDVVLRGDTTLYVGMDFNVGKMASIVHVLRNGLPRAVDEIIDAYDTPDMIRILKERYWKFDEETRQYKKIRNIRVYPDASGKSRSSANASTSDLALLRAAGFTVVVDADNPPVRDRIVSMNAMFCNSLGVRRYLVNAERCPTYADCLEQQAWTDSGEPDKSTGHDHAVDAGGYYLIKEFGIKKHFTVTEETIN